MNSFDVNFEGRWPKYGSFSRISSLNRFFTSPASIASPTNNTTSQRNAVFGLGDSLPNCPRSDTNPSALIACVFPTRGTGPTGVGFPGSRRLACERHTSISSLLTGKTGLWFRYTGMEGRGGCSCLENGREDAKKLTFDKII